MIKVREVNGSLVACAYQGDAKTLLAFNITAPQDRERLAGFTIQVKPDGRAAYFLWNKLQFAHPAQHAQDAAEPAYSTVNAPLHRFRWVHVPGSDHQGLTPPFGRYAYTATPRYFDDQRRLMPLDPARGATVEIELKPFQQGPVRLGFTRGYAQSQAYVNHFGHDLVLKPPSAPLVFDTHQIAGQNAQGNNFTYLDVYSWAGASTRERIVDVLNLVHDGPNRQLDVFAYDLNEPDIITALLSLGQEKRVRVILDNASLHKSTAEKPSTEDEFEARFVAVAGQDAMLRGKFGRYAHDKVFVVYADKARQQPELVLTGSTNLSITGLYVNANHVLVFDDPAIAGVYASAFQAAWTTKVQRAAFAESALATTTHSFTPANTGAVDIDFSPHLPADKDKVLGRIVARIEQESQIAENGSVLFAVMTMDGATAKGQPAKPNMVYDSLKSLHESETIFSYGISDSPGQVWLYGADTRGGVLVSGKPGQPLLPPPFEQVPSIGSGHEIHHKFVVCGFGRPDAVVFCGSSNLAEGGELENGDNLLGIHDPAIATAFAIETLLLVDHYNFLNRLSTKTTDSHTLRSAADNRTAAKAAEWFLGTTDQWARPYFVEGSTRSRDRQLFTA
ncbi:phospholipase D-like domain-containing protein [Pandoraea pneumonica]|uniref:phospholipase D-like domain-containing protein n=1 Tax=Pandoraea pneumonica TaxID=2508299 RepID=UPI003CF26DC7